jgi:hypothetical protein
MVKAVRILFMCVAALSAALLSALGLPRESARESVAPQPQDSVETGFRARLAEDPAAALRDSGIDPALFNLQDAAQRRGRSDATRGESGTPASPARQAGGQPLRLADGAPPVPVYGPPPSPNPNPPPPDDQSGPDVKPHREPPVVVYGPPPSPGNKLRPDKHPKPEPPVVVYGPPPGQPLKPPQ